MSGEIISDDEGGDDDDADDDDEDTYMQKQREKLEAEKEAILNNKNLIAEVWVCQMYCVNMHILNMISNKSTACSRQLFPYDSLFELLKMVLASCYICYFSV